LKELVTPKSQSWIKVSAQFTIAMSLQAANRQVEAVAALAEANKLLAESAPANVRAAGDVWSDWLTCQLLKREAEGMVKGSAKPNK
jgi:hypothetical protein